MEESRRYIRLGLFVVVSLSVLAAALFVLGGRELFQPTFTFETYFDQSVAGLDLGAPVRFRGVPLGQVSEILTSATAYEHDVPRDRGREYIVVRVKINLSGREGAHMKQDLVTLARKGLRAQTQLAGLTGQQYLSLDFLDPQKYPPLGFAWKPKYAYLPSAPSSAGEIMADAQTFLASLNEVDLRTLSRNLNALVSHLDTKVGEVPVAELSASAHDVLVKADATLGRIDSASARLDTLLGDPALKQTVANAAVISARLGKLAEDGDVDRMVKGIDEAAQRLDVMLGDNQYDVRTIVQDLRVAADNLRVLSETLKRDPAGILVGGPPEKIQLPGNSQ
jgi:phospholipid/cholesterol/gamma-HCH transport system substrate-binding protein/paraquat-inducible protein B